MRKVKSVPLMVLIMLTLMLTLNMSSTVVGQSSSPSVSIRGPSYALRLFSTALVTVTPPSTIVLPGSAGGAIDDHSPVPLTPQQEKDLAQKHALMDQIRQLKAAGYQPAQIREMLNLPSVISPLGGIDQDHGNCNMSIWKEPENQPNWCGPGSGEAVLSNWRSIPPAGYANAAAYMTYLATKACKLGQTPPNCTGMMSGSTTTVANWIYIVNNEIGSGYYERAYLTGLTDFKNKLEMDIYWSSHPVNNLIWTAQLPGWGGYGCNHYVAAEAYNFPANLIYYGDTAPDSANGNGTPNPYGWHSMALSTFYAQLGPANGGTPTIMW